MKRSAQRSSRHTAIPRAWHEAEYAALRVNAADTCDDRVSDSIYEDEDERAEVDSILHRLPHESN